MTLEDAIYIKMKNDVAFIIGPELSLYEQQFAINPNMPFRNLYYVAEELKKIAPVISLYHTIRVSTVKTGTIYFHTLY